MTKLVYTRRKEHKKNVEHCKVGSNIANNGWKNNRKIDFNNGKIIDKGNFRHHGTLHAQKNSENNSRH